MGTFVSISGGGNASVHIYGNGTVAAGNGNDTINITGNGDVSVGAGYDQIALRGSGTISQHNSGGMIGNDTITLGNGSDSIAEAGTATVKGSFGNATVQGGTFDFYRADQNTGHGHTDWVWQQVASTGNATLVGGDHCTQFVGGSGSVSMHGGTADSTMIGGSGQTTMTGGSGHNLFSFSGTTGGTDLVTNFVSGQDKLSLDGQSLCYLNAHGEVNIWVGNGNTYISLDGGKTMVELKGFTHLTNTDVTTKG